MMMHRHTFVLLLLTSFTVVSAPSCLLAIDRAGGGDDDDDDDDDDGLGPGESQCGQVVCSAGQYCLGGFCNNGCTSDANCLDGVQCVDISEVTGDGVCENGAGGEGEGEGDPPPDDNTCDGYADHAETCGLSASNAEAIRQQCDTLSQDEQEAIIACNTSESCSEFRSCSGVECFQDVDCPAARPDCIDPADVVDPFTDIPFTCR